MLWLALAAPLHAGDAPDYRGAKVRTDFTRDRVVSVVVGLGGSWILGGNAEGYGAGVAERASVDLALGRASAFCVDLDHARHTLRDAAAYFPDASVPADATPGFRDYLTVDAGFRIGVPLVDDAPSDVVTAVPYLRLGVGATLTTTLLDVPAFTGRLALRSQTLVPSPSVGLGVEIRIRRWITVVPHVKAQFAIARDVGEVDLDEQWGMESRIQPAIDVAFNF